MAFEKDLFISYSHIDNTPLFEGQNEGWVSRFHKTLAANLQFCMGKPPAIWRDLKLTGLDKFDQEIHDQISKAAMLISVVSPRYVLSKWCTEEVRAFCESAQQTGGDSVGNRCRIAKIIMFPVDNEDPLPPVMRQLLGYPFYTVDDQQTPILLDPALGADKAGQFNMKIYKLACDLRESLRKLPAPSSSTAAPPTTPAGTVVSAGAAAAAVRTAPNAKPVIYLAQCAYDCRDAREAVETDLRTQGYTVLPDTTLSNLEDEFTAQVRAMLDTARLAIHMVGAAPGLVPDGPAQKPAVVLQHELAVEKSKAGALERVIWLPAGAVSTNPTHQQFIERLRRDPEAQYRADLVTADLETLKGAVHSALRKLEEPPRPKPAVTTGAASKSIYMIFDDDDRKATVPLRKYLRSLGHEVATPVFEGDAATVRKANDDQLALCDAVLVYYGAGDEAWYRSVKIDLRKLKGTRADRPLEAEYTFLGGPSSNDKQDLVDLGEPGVIDGRNGFVEAQLSEFAGKLEHA